jgi:hypothetical protein
MGISRSAYYNAPTGAPDDTAIAEAMSAIRDGGRGTPRRDGPS